jgi:hypothetical protein
MFYPCSEILNKGANMHKMSKDSATIFAGLQSRVNQSESILKAILDDNVPREHLISLVTTYFNPIKIREDNHEKKI